MAKYRYSARPHNDPVEAVFFPGDNGGDGVTVRFGQTEELSEAQVARVDPRYVFEKIVPPASPKKESVAKVYHLEEVKN